MSERIAAAACVHKGEVYQLPPPARHGDVIQYILAVCAVPASDWPICPPNDQGFVTSEGRFVGRAEAREIAEAAGQIIPRVDEDGVTFTIQHHHLFSEDVW